MIFNSSSFGVFELLLILRVLYSFEILLDNHVLNTYEHRFGMLMVELFTQQAPYSDQLRNETDTKAGMEARQTDNKLTLQQLSRQIIGGLRPNLDNIPNSYLSHSLKSLIQSCLHLDPAQRPVSMVKIHAALEDELKNSEKIGPQSAEDSQSAEDLTEFQTLQVAAERGDAEQQYRLGDAYENGDITKQDYKQAVHWYRKASDQDHVYATYNLGWCYEQGNGVDQDYEAAVALYRKSAAMGDKNSMYWLGICYENGNGVPGKDLSEALRWHRLAVQHGSTEAHARVVLLEPFLESLI